MNSSAPDHAKWVSFRDYLRTYNAFAERYVRLSGDKSVTLYQNLDKLSGSMDTVWPLQKQYFEKAYMATLILSGLLSQFDSGVSASVSEIQDLLGANLRKVIYTEPEREVDVQNAIETLLVGRGYQKGVHYDREAGKFKFSGKEFIPDFVFPGLKVALEVKLIKERGQVSTCVEEMSADTTAYLSVYDTVLFCVYDLGVVRDEVEFQGGIQSNDRARVCLVKH